MIGRYFQHYKGSVYKVLHVGVMENTLKPVVIYQRRANNEDDNIVWVREMDDFISYVSTDVRRFTELKEVNESI